jgi:DNA polymerase I
MARPQLFLIDSFGFIFRAFHARARSTATPMRTANGVPTEATYIFNNMIRRLRDQYQPEYLAAIFESEGPNFRNDLFADYKANRSETPPDLLQQIPDIKRLLEAMRVPVVEAAGFEADDVIGTLAQLASEQVDVVIVSSDKDMLQLVGPSVTMLNPMKDDLRYDDAAVEEFMGVKPAQVVDLLALKGDSVDNIPGAPGIGDKGARDLIQQFGSVETAIDRAAEVSRKMYRESLQQNRDQILLSKQLARIRTDVPLDFQLEALRRVEPDRKALEEVYRQLEFHRALREVQTVAADADRDVQEVRSANEIAALEAAIRERGSFSVVEVVPDEAALATAGRWYLGLGPSTVRVLPDEATPQVLAWLCDSRLGKVLANYKDFLLRHHGTQSKAVELLAGPVDDVLLMGFLLYAEPGAATLPALSERRLQRGTESSPEATASLLMALRDDMLPALRENELEAAYQEIDLPLSPVLARMEHTGIRVDRETLAEISTRMQGELESLTAQIYQHAGHEFNINSPQQLARVLFEEMGLPAPVKTGKGKVHSTAADVLEGLATRYPIAQLVLDYRQIAKLKGTYVDALPALLRPETGRIHTSFNQAGAATGRLSSSNPNLQNIPIRSEQGREIRAAFVPEPGWTLLAADYSQIELRLLAHFSEDPVLVDSFQRNEDIHTRTAAEVFGVMPGLVTSEMRRNAKAVNFGIVYGQTAFGLASALGISKKEAEEYIARYFDRYQGVRTWIQQTIEEVRAAGLTRTLFGRMRPIPDINVRNPNARSFAERTAVNTPLQGTAADLIKVAMIRIQHLLDKEGFRTRMLLQVHDELVFEAPPEEEDAVAAMVRKEMEGVASLLVPLVAEVGRGPNWRDAK